MVDIFGLSGAQFETFLLVFLRVTSMLYVFPVFSAPQIPTLVRLGLGSVISFILWRLVPVVHMSTGLYDLILAAVSQLVIGILIGYIASLVFTGIQFAGELIDLMIGFAIANVINPQTQQNITVIGEFELAIATLVFLATDSHYFLIQGIAGSFTLAPLPYIGLDPSIAGNVALFFSQAFLVVFRIAAPVVVALFLTNIVLAFMARVAPQMNVFVVGLPIQVGVGLIMMAISIPLMATIGPDLFQSVAREMDTVMRGLRV